MPLFAATKLSKNKTPQLGRLVVRLAATALWAEADPGSFPKLLQTILPRRRLFVFRFAFPSAITKGRVIIRIGGICRQASSSKIFRFFEFA
jgi:hypothetical protein